MNTTNPQELHAQNVDIESFNVLLISAQKRVYDTEYVKDGG